MKIRSTTSIILLFIIIALSNITLAQTKETSEDSPVKGIKSLTDHFDTTLVSREYLRALLLDSMNLIRKSANLEELSINVILNNAAQYQAKDMSHTEELLIETSGKYRTTGERVMLYGGSSKATEATFKIMIGSGKEYATFGAIITELSDKIRKGKAGPTLIANVDNLFIGLGIAPDKLGKKGYVSIVLGNYSTFDVGLTKRNELNVPFTDKLYGLNHYDVKNCKNAEKFEDQAELMNGLYIEGSKIHLKYHDLKGLMKLLKNDDDAIALDLVQQQQYPCKPYNIIDGNLPNKGILQKPIFMSKLFKNVGPETKKTNQFDEYIGDLPDKFASPYEINLIIIQEGAVCLTLTRSFDVANYTHPAVDLDKLFQVETISAELPESKAYNDIAIQLNRNDLKDEAQSKEFQTIITTQFSKLDTVAFNSLNLKFHLKRIKEPNLFLKPAETLKESLAVIKTQIDHGQISQDKILAITTYLIDIREFRLASTILFPYLSDKKLSEDYIFNYVIATSNLADKTKTKAFALALDKAKNINSKRYCKLFNDHLFSFQLFDNPFIKDTYCNTCK